MRSALIVNLLTEDNLPYYFETINRMFANDVWREWARRWTAEEMRHGIVIRDYITVTHAVDLDALEHARMHQVCGAARFRSPNRSVDTLVYVALQELATRISHRNTGNLLDDEAGYKVMARVAADENLHYLFYRDLVSAALEIDPSGHRAARSSARCARSRCRASASPTSARTRPRSRPPGSTTSSCTTIRCSSRSCCGTGASRRSRGSPPSPEAELARERIVQHIARIERIGRRLARAARAAAAGARACTPARG